MTTFRAMRQADGELPATGADAQPPDLSGFAGSWKSSDPATRGITALEVPEIISSVYRNPHL